VIRHRVACLECRRVVVRAEVRHCQFNVWINKSIMCVLQVFCQWVVCLPLVAHHSR
jgi:hypothetical protein